MYPIIEVKSTRKSKFSDPRHLHFNLRLLNRFLRLSDRPISHGSFQLFLLFLLGLAPLSAGIFDKINSPNLLLLIQMLIVQNKIVDKFPQEPILILQQHLSLPKIVRSNDLILDEIR